MPLGKKLAKKDQGELTVACYISGDQIVMDFGKDLSWVALDPAGWRGVIKVLENKIKEVETK